MGNPYIVAAKKAGAPWAEGITRKRVLDHDGWRCRMPQCLYPHREIDPNVPGHDEHGRIPEERGTVDHIVPLSEEGTPGHVWANVRAAHRLCNRVGFRPANLIEGLTVTRIKDLLEKAADDLSAYNGTMSEETITRARKALARILGAFDVIEGRPGEPV